MVDFRTRLMHEYRELRERVAKLEMFTLTSEFHTAITQADRDDLREQLEYMQKYRDVLSRRVSRLCEVRS